MPQPLSHTVQNRLRNQRTTGTDPEMAIRRLSHAQGLRYRVNARPERDLRVKPDMIFTRQRLAVFIDGCFWHGCPTHFIPPTNNAEWWASKINANIARDQASREQLRSRGWRVLSIWEHEPPEEAVLRIHEALSGEPSSGPQT